MNNGFNKELINVNVSNDELIESITSNIIKIKSPSFKVEVEMDEILKIIVTFKEEKQEFEVFEVTPEAIDVAITKVNEYIRGL